MNLDRKLTGYILRYLLEHQFSSKSEMARQLGLNLDATRRLLRSLDDTKAGTVALDKAILFCVCHDISLDAILHDFIEENGGIDLMQENCPKTAAYQRLRMKKPIGLTRDGEDIYDSLAQFVRGASSQVCPCCEQWCNPRDDECDINEMDCYIGNLADDVFDSVSEMYTVPLVTT